MSNKEPVKLYHLGHLTFITEENRSHLKTRASPALQKVDASEDMVSCVLRCKKVKRGTGLRARLEKEKKI